MPVVRRWKLRSCLTKLFVIYGIIVCILHEFLIVKICIKRYNFKTRNSFRCGLLAWHGSLKCNRRFSKRDSIAVGTAVLFAKCESPLPVIQKCSYHPSVFFTIRFGGSDARLTRTRDIFFATIFACLWLKLSCR